ncbi:MAG: cobalt-precorrin-5B (C(1))-methyltransferase CbiD [Solirubrobacteraceae bacterium]|nr:cobalt-precorrin-5B (C(1))-methyltransferase CbiD [Solirubrobacteraceae bacterium]
MTESGSELRSGLTTGTCAAAAAAAAAHALTGSTCDAVDVELPDGERVTLSVEWVELPRPGRARAAVVKDAGDDPDVTDGMTVVAEVEIVATGDAAVPPPAIEFVAGPGVGSVTRAGLQIPPGEPAINPVPRQMIAAAVGAVLAEQPLRVTVSIPGGEQTAKRTYNERLGIVGGLSVLGTSGRVVPKSEDAWVRSLLPQVDVALADDRDTVYLAPGGFGERAARERFGAAETQIVQCANFVGDLLDRCVDAGVARVVLVGHAGKLVKVAAGVWNTHSRVADARLETLAALAAAAGAPPTLVTKVLELPTVEAAVATLADAGLDEVWDDVAERAARRAAERAGRRAGEGAVPRCDCAVVAYDGEVIGRSAALRAASAAAASVEDAPEAGPASAALPVLELAVVGTGPGAAEWLTPAAWQVIRRADVVAGGRRQLERFAPAGAEQVVVGADMVSVAAALRTHAGRRVVVLASGDPGFFGIPVALRRLLPGAEIVTLPGVSSAQLAAARLGRPWHDLHFASAHGLEIEGVVADVRAHPHVLALTDARRTPQALAAALVAAGIEARVTVLERLGEPGERITSGAAASVAAQEFDGLSVVVVDREEPA